MGYISNAYAPLVWFVVFLIIPLCVILIAVEDKIVRYIVLSFLLLLIVFTLVIYVVLLKKDPKLLQSEWYRLEDKRLDLIAQKGEEGSIIVTEHITGSEIIGESKDG